MMVERFTDIPSLVQLLIDLQKMPRGTKAVYTPPKPCCVPPNCQHSLSFDLNLPLSLRPKLPKLEFGAKLEPVFEASVSAGLDIFADALIKVGLGVTFGGTTEDLNILGQLNTTIWSKTSGTLCEIEANSSYHASKMCASGQTCDAAGCCETCRDGFKPCGSRHYLGTRLAMSIGRWALGAGSAGCVKAHPAEPAPSAHLG